MHSISTFSSISFLSFEANGHGNSRYPGAPWVMHVVKAIFSAPLFFISKARAKICLPGQPPQLLIPIISTGAVSENPPSPFAATERHEEAGH